jgi:uncharacterized protein
MSTASATASASVELVRSLFEAFNRGDIPSILGRVASDCQWVCPAEGLLPYGGTFSGPQGAAEFFQKLGATEVITLFEPREYFTSGDDVVALGYEEGRAIATGRTASSQWAMLFRFRGGQVVEWRTHFDTGAYSRAHQG